MVVEDMAVLEFDLSLMLCCGEGRLFKIWESNMSCPKSRARAERARRAEQASWVSAERARAELVSAGLVNAEQASAEQVRAEQASESERPSSEGIEESDGSPPPLLLSGEDIDESPLPSLSGEDIGDSPSPPPLSSEDIDESPPPPMFKRKTWSMKGNEIWVNPSVPPEGFDFNSKGTGSISFDERRFYQLIGGAILAGTDLGDMVNRIVVINGVEIEVNCYYNPEFRDHPYFSTPRWLKWGNVNLKSGEIEEMVANWEEHQLERPVKPVRVNGKWVHPDAVTDRGSHIEVDLDYG